MKLTPVANAPENNIRMRQESVKLYINKDFKGTGVLYVTEDNVVWMDSSQDGLTVDYLSISIFAVCTDREKYNENCVFLLVNDDDSDGGETDDDDSNDSVSTEAEIRFAPPDGVDVHDIFNAIQDCNKLHAVAPDDDMVSEDSVEEEEEEEEGSGDHSDSNVIPNGDHENGINGQFEDAEMN